jgi:hypothetical protein
MMMMMELEVAVAMRRSHGRSLEEMPVDWRTPV